jgi:nicotinamidase-related amidase
VNALSPALAKADSLAAWIASERTALIIIDMQVDFGSPEGAVGQWGVDISTVPAALAAAERLAGAARAAGVPVIFVGLMTSPETDSPAWSERMRRRGGDPESESRLCRIGETGSHFYGPHPAPGEKVVAKTRYSGFHGTDLNTVLKSLEVDTLVVCGLTTECCVGSTAWDAFHLDYHVFVATDACAAYEADLHTGALKSLELNCAILATSAEIMAAWAEAKAHG